MSVEALELRVLSRLPAPWRLRLALRLEGKRIEVDVVSAFVARNAWTVCEAVYILAAARLGRVTPSQVARAARARAGFDPDAEGVTGARGDGRRETAMPSWHSGDGGRRDLSRAERDAIGAGRAPPVKRRTKPEDTTLTWDEVSGGLAGVVPELVEGSDGRPLRLGEALAAAGAELVGAWSGPEARIGGDDGKARADRGRGAVRNVRKGKGRQGAEVPAVPDGEHG